MLKNIPFIIEKYKVKRILEWKRIIISQLIKIYTVEFYLNTENIIYLEVIFLVKIAGIFYLNLALNNLHEIEGELKRDPLQSASLQI